MKIKDISNKIMSNTHNCVIEKWTSIILQSITIGLFMGYIAIQHNPQNEYINTENGSVNISILLETVAIWTIGTMIFCLIISVISIVLIKIVRSALNIQLSNKR